MPPHQGRRIDNWMQPQGSVKNRWISEADSSAFCRLSPPDARFRQNLWESGTPNRAPKYGWLSGACQGVTYRWCFRIPNEV
jgi:hypothetical protein